MVAELHAPLLPILRHVLALTPLPRSGLALDLACGPGHKAPLLAEACGPGVRLLGVDIDPAAIRGLTNDQRPTTNDHRPPTNDQRPMTNEDRGLKIEDSNEGADEALSSILYPPSSNNRSFVVRRSSFVGIVGDAQALPLRDGCCAAAFCIAALSLFADRRAALRELRRVLAPGGVALLVVGAQSWAQIVDWPADLAARLAAVYTQALAAGIAPLPTSPDLGGDLADLLLEAGFTAPLIRAFRLDRPTTNDQRPTTNDQRLPRTEDRGLRTEDRGLRTERRNSEPQTTDYRLRTTDSALAAELPLLPWPALRPLLAGQLPPAELVRCDELAADPQIELCALALVAQAHAA